MQPLNSVPVDLSTPIQAHGETVYALSLKPPILRDLKAMDAVKGEMAKTIQLISQLAQIPLSSAEEISAQDLTEKIAPVLAGFLGNSQATGET